VRQKRRGIRVKFESLEEGAGAAASALAHFSELHDPVCMC